MDKRLATKMVVSRFFIWDSFYWLYGFYKLYSQPLVF